MKKKSVIWSVVAVLAVILVLVGVTAAQVGGEASSMDKALKEVHGADGVTKAQALLKPMGVDNFKQEPGKLVAETQKHSLLVYTAWLKVAIKTDDQGGYGGYHISFESKWF